MSEGRIQNVAPKEYKGVHYRSTLEADTAKVLDELGVPFEYEKLKYELLDGFTCPYQKSKVRSIVYIPDFKIGKNILLECKGFETPEWKIKKKLVFKYLLENDPQKVFYQTHDSRKDLLSVLDNHWKELGYCIEVISKKRKKVVTEGSNKLTYLPEFKAEYSSVHEAMEQLGLKYKNLGPILKSLMGKTDFTYGYKWTLKPEENKQNCSNNSN